MGEEARNWTEPPITCDNKPPPPFPERRKMGIKDRLYQPIVTSVREPVSRVGVVAVASLMIGCIALILVLAVVAEMGKVDASN